MMAPRSSFVYLTLIVVVFGKGSESLPISGFRLTPPENVWARTGETVTLRCKSDKPIRSCAWTTPYEKNYVLEEGLKAEGGRLSYYSQEEQSDGVTECGILIKTIENRDLGKWSCNIGVVEEDEIKSASGQASIRLASPPQELSLTFSPQEDLNDTQSEAKASCEVKYASPKPSFEWFIDGEKVVMPEVRDFFHEENTYIQVLTNLVDIMESQNATLTCSVSHLALNETLSESVEVYVEEEEETFLDDIIGQDTTMDLDYFGLLEEDESLDEIPILVVILIGIAITLIGIFVILHRRGKLNLCKGRNHEVVALDKNTTQDLEGKINHHIDDSESTDSIVKQVTVPESYNNSTSEEEKKDLPEKAFNEVNLRNEEESPGF
ncbi:uncharacterized protein [Lepeophtheirus salmonis]|nr:uncharacterized protein LOC121126339 [Lepeophtheirus salmonis]